MASITINFPDEQQTRIRNALCEYAGYQPTLEDGSPNPVTKAAFAKDVVKGIIRDIVRQVERNAALKAVDSTPAPDLT